MPSTKDTNPALTSPSVPRNRDPILAVLRSVLPATGTVLEIASGTGEHAAYFAAALPDLTWQPSDPDPTAISSIAAYRAAAALPNLLAPARLDAATWPWPVRSAAAIVAINLVHISPWRATEGLMAGAGRLLQAGDIVYLYGAYKVNGDHTAPSNAAFDRDLRARNPEWGVRDVNDVSDLAERHGLDLVESIAMPSNNLSLVFRKEAAAGRG